MKFQKKLSYKFGAVNWVDVRAIPRYVHVPASKWPLILAFLVNSPGLILVIAHTHRCWYVHLL